MKKIILSIGGMTCSACSSGLEKYLNKQNGIIEASVNLIMANATIIYDENILDNRVVEEFIKKAGFKSLGEFKEINIENKNKKEKNKFIIFTILAVLLLYISLAHMLNLPIFNFLDSKTNLINYTLCLFIFAIIFMIYGYDILKNGYKNLIHKTPNMDTLVGIGVLSSFLYSCYTMIMILKGDLSEAQNLYFESTAIIIYFIKLGRYLDNHSKDKTKDAIQKLVKITPNKATIKVQNGEKEVTLDEIHTGDILISRPGEKIAVDGEIIKGKAHFDEAFITGESKPRNKTEGDNVIAGSLNYDGYIEYKALKIGKESKISEIVRLVIEASNTKVPLAKIADTVSGYFVPTVIIIALLTFIIYLLLGNEFGISLIRFVTVLVVACPCSLGLSTPLAVVIANGLSASNGILVKKSEIYENASKVNTIVFDKTGTLTYGKLKIKEIKNYSKIKDKELLKLVGSIESKVTHPIGESFVNYLEENKIKKLEVREFKNIIGMGVIGNVNNQKLIIGNSKILKKYNIENIYNKDEEELTKKGNSIVYVASEKEILALIGVNDIVREEAKEVIKKFNKNNIETIMLTGDNKKTALKIAKEIGITKVISNVLPTEKREVIKTLKSQNKFVMMVGDGINDSPSLMEANIGVSVNEGTSIAMDSSDVILTNNNLNGILNLINISKKTIKIIKENLFWAFFYNSLMIPIAVGIFNPFGIMISPIMGSIAMVISSITVILNALRLKKINLN